MCATMWAGEGGFPGGSLVKNPPASAGDKGSILDPGRSHMPQATKSECYNYWACALEPRLLKPTCPRARTQNKRCHRNERPAHHNQRVAPLATTKEKPVHAIAFSNAWKWKVKSESEVTQSLRLPATPWTAAHQAPPSMGFSRLEYWSGCHCPLRIGV